MIAKDVFNTVEPMTARGRSTYNAISARLAAMHPPIYLERQIGTFEGMEDSSLRATDSTLDGINFVADDPKRLSGALDHANDQDGNLAFISMKEDPQHWALKASFAATVGTGFREVWRPAMYDPPGATPDEPGKMDDMMKMRFGKAGNRVSFTALHCAIDEITGNCNIHIDEAGFMLGLPNGVSMTPDFYGHIINELKWKTDFRDWMEGKLVDHEILKEVIHQVVRRVSIDFINSANGYAGLDKKINSIHSPGDLPYTAVKIFAPIGLTFDAYQGDNVKVQVVGSWLDGDLTLTVSVGGKW